MNVRRVVIATDPSGRSVVSSDGASPRAHDFVHTPGFAQALVWTCDLSHDYVSINADYRS